MQRKPGADLNQLFTTSANNGFMSMIWKSNRLPAFTRHQASAGDVAFFVEEYASYSELWIVGPGAPHVSKHESAGEAKTYAVGIVQSG